MKLYRGIVYLIQPEILIGTNRYKIGCSSKENINRLKSYSCNSRFLCVMNCNKPFEFEKIIKNKFNEKFNLIGGHEYFEGDEDDIVLTFIDIIHNNKNYLVNNIDDNKKIKNDNEIESKIDCINNNINIINDKSNKKKLYVHDNKKINYIKNINILLNK